MQQSGRKLTDYFYDEGIREDHDTNAANAIENLIYNGLPKEQADELWRVLCALAERRQAHRECARISD